MLLLAQETPVSIFDLFSFNQNLSRTYMGDYFKTEGTEAGVPDEAKLS